MIIKEHRPDHIEIERAHRNKVGNGTFEKEGLHVADGTANSQKKSASRTSSNHPQISFR